MGHPSYGIDGAERPTGITSSVVDPQHPASLAAVNATAGYYPDGQLREMTYGNNLTETFAYNSRLQPCRINVNSSGTLLSTCADLIPSGNLQDFNLGYNAGSTDNGNLMSMVGTGSQAFNRSYGYDQVNRLSSMTDSASGQKCKGLQWTDDAWGNMTSQAVTAGSCYTFSAAATTNNQLVGYQYDSAGNMTSDGKHTYYYDAENRLIQLDGTLGTCSSATECYSYDTQGRRTEKISGGSAWLDRVLDLNGNPIVIYNSTGSQAAYISFRGSFVAQYSGNTTFFVQVDQVGSTRLMTNVSGGISDSRDYLPFGEQVAGSGGQYGLKFNGKERDLESGLDMFGARYYGSSLGRFMTPDWAAKPTNVPYASFGNPQSLNLYSYVNNNPTTTRDPDGHCAEDACVIEGSAALLYVGGAALIAGTAAVLNTPAGQRSLSTFTSAASQSISRRGASQRMSTSIRPNIRVQRAI